MSVLTAVFRTVPLLGLGAATALVLTQIDFVSTPGTGALAPAAAPVVPSDTAEARPPTDHLDEDLKQAMRITQNLTCQSLMLQQAPLPPHCIELTDGEEETVEKMLTEVLKGANP